MLRRVPLDKKGNVRYPEFLATFDAGRFDNKSLWEVRPLAYGMFPSGTIKHK